MSDRSMPCDGVGAMPVLVTPLNCEIVVGDTWRHLNEWARDHGVCVYRLGNRPGIVTTELLSAIRKHGAPQPEELEAPTGATEAEKGVSGAMHCMCLLRRVVNDHVLPVAT